MLLHLVVTQKLNKSCTHFWGQRGISEKWSFKLFRKRKLHCLRTFLHIACQCPRQRTCKLRFQSYAKVWIFVQKTTFKKPLKKTLDFVYVLEQSCQKQHNTNKMIKWRNHSREKFWERCWERDVAAVREIERFFLTAKIFWERFWERFLPKLWKFPHQEQIRGVPKNCGAFPVIILLRKEEPFLGTKLICVSAAPRYKWDPHVQGPKPHDRLRTCKLQA